MSAIKSPCINVCIIGGRAKQCWGCGRTRAEIAGWTKYTDKEREDIMRVLPDRVRALHEELNAQIASKPRPTPTPGS